MVVVVFIAWIVILFTGRYPRGLFDFVQGVTRWGARVVAYAFVLVTDSYPPFSPAPQRPGECGAHQGLSLSRGGAK